jgi:signal transduction histidine kinase
MDRDEIEVRSDPAGETEHHREEFLAMLAHELRNPLVPLRNAIELLRRVEPHDPKVAYACALAERQIKYLTRLIDELLDVSRLLRGRIALRKEVFDLLPLVRQAAEDVQQQLASRRHKLSLRLPNEPVPVDGDALRLLQAIEHLLNNAVRYTNPGGHIVMELEDTGAEGIVRVRDNGIGLSPELLPRVFDLFVQGERPLDRAHGGIGIGLSLVKKVVELHGGHVEARSAGEGRGAEFILHIPRRVDGNARAVTVAEPEVMH